MRSHPPVYGHWGHLEREVGVRWREREVAMGVRWVFGVVGWGAYLHCRLEVDVLTHDVGHPVSVSLPM